VQNRLVVSSLDLVPFMRMMPLYYLEPQSPDAPMFRILTQPHAIQSTPNSHDAVSAEREFRQPTPSSRSRSRSVVPYEDGGDDISVIMMRGASEVRNVRAELDEQVH
jgi:hypothetical protein